MFENKKIIFKSANNLQSLGLIGSLFRHGLQVLWWLRFFQAVSSSTPHLLQVWLVCAGRPLGFFSAGN